MNDCFRQARSSKSRGKSGSDKSIIENNCNNRIIDTYPLGTRNQILLAHNDHKIMLFNILFTKFHNSHYLTFQFQSPKALHFHSPAAASFTTTFHE
jgi:hypothetical protein